MTFKSHSNHSQLYDARHQPSVDANSLGICIKKYSNVANQERA